MKSIILMLGMIFLVACVGVLDRSRIAVLQHPETKQTVECRADPMGDSNFRKQVEFCIKAYKNAGYLLRSDVGHNNSNNYDYKN
jgi:hypothetical protein